MNWLRQLLDDETSTVGRRFNLLLQGLIILSLVTFSIETLPDLDERSRQLLRYCEVIFVAIFTVEYLARLLAAKNRKKFVFSFFGIVDLVAILPFYLALGLDLRAVRGLRMLRLVRLLKLARYNKAMKRLHCAFVIAKEELVMFVFATILTLYVAAVGIYFFENPAQPDSFSSIFSSLWWAVATLTTVGYGDIYPITAGGKVFTFLILILGLGIVSIPAGMVASALGEAREMEDK
ncbi:ion transporter [Ferrimonas lipolytica]|uniref:Ion transporter n=1 Tax=Ferrimonas lipolytica TaxID=2724191 RepID=A0A6H1U9U3_9GAMM|nr:ion transporter [Ferrimonas lipolytica]QIZ75817.1 ion transporter [Ferrimonas lipolytica]